VFYSLSQKNIMKNFIRTLVLIALAFFTTASFAAESVHLMLKGSGGKVYACKTDASGKFTFDKVEPGTYQLVCILPDGKSPDNTESASIEIQSFSWGATQMGSHGGSTGAGRVTTTSTTTPALDPDDDGDGVSSEKITKSRSNIQNNRTINTSRDNIKHNAASKDFQQLPGGKYCVVVMKDIVVSSLGSCEGSCSMAINEKGLPGEKGTKKGNK
jgi:hypothetical protein